MKNSLLVGVMVGVAWVSYSIGTGVFEAEKPPMMHKLKAPLMLSGGSASKHQCVLPAGASLYYDQAFPEGFVRYKVYVNVEGVSLDVAPPTDKFWLDPLVAFPFGKEQLNGNVENYPVKRAELRELLASGVITKDEIRQLLEEFSR